MSTRTIPKWPQAVYKRNKYGSGWKHTQNTLYHGHHIILEVEDLGEQTVMMRMYIRGIHGLIGWCSRGPRLSSIHHILHRDRLAELHDRTGGDFNLGDMPTMDKVIQYFFPNYYMELLL